jgi:polyhydroxybutyrate depolymerase
VILSQAMLMRRQTADRWLAGMLAALFMLAPLHAAVISAGTMVRPEGQRDYLLAQAQTPAPGKRALVILLHGHGGSASLAFGREKFTDPAVAWLDVVDRENVLLIAPQGTKGSDKLPGWNDCRADAPTNPTTDDVGLIGALIDKAIAELGADPERVYITGISNGGTMTYRAGMELKQPVAAIAVLSGLMPARSLCAAPTRALPVLVTHGTSDKISPYAGGAISHWMLSGRGSGISADTTSATRYVWDADPAGMQVEFLKIDGGGHVQPSIRRRVSATVVFLLGNQNGDVEFVDEAWSFFRDKRAAVPVAR